MGKKNKVEPEEEVSNAEVKKLEKLIDLPMGEMEKKAAKMASEKEPATYFGKRMKVWRDNWFKFRHGVSKAAFSETVQGNTPLLKLMSQLNVTEREATGFLKIFEQIDMDHSGTIDLFEFFNYFKLDRNKFVERAFSVLDFNQDKTAEDKGDGQLNYTEFFISLYNFCSQTHDSLVRFSFAVMDADHGGSISTEELFQMIEMMHDDESGGSAKQTRHIMQVLDNDGDGEITLDEFIRANRKVGTLMFPAFRLQKKMRNKTMSKKFWVKATKARVEAMKRGEEDLIDKFHRVVAEVEMEEAAARARELAEEERKRAEEDEANQDATRELTDEEQLAIQQQADQAFKDMENDRNEIEDEEQKEEVAKLPLHMQPFGVRPGTRSGDWWDEAAVSELGEDAAHVPDRPTTPSVNLKKERKKLHVEIKTADKILDAKRARKKANYLIEKSHEVEHETLDLIHRLEEEEKEPPRWTRKWFKWKWKRKMLGVDARRRRRKMEEAKAAKEAAKQEKKAEKERWAAIARGEDVDDIHGAEDPG